LLVVYFVTTHCNGLAIAPKSELLDSVATYVDKAGHTVQTFFGPLYSWMMQLGMDVYGLKDPSIFRYWNAPEQISTAISYVVEPTEKEKQEMIEIGVSTSNPVRTSIKAAKALIDGESPVETVLNDLSDGSPAKKALRMATGREPISMASLGIPMPPAFDPLKMIFGSPEKKGNDPLSALLGTALPQTEAVSKVSQDTKSLETKKDEPLPQLLTNLESEKHSAQTIGSSSMKLIPSEALFPSNFIQNPQSTVYLPMNQIADLNLLKKVLDSVSP